MPPAKVIWECKPRTRAKLEIISHYLGAWFSILASKSYPHVVYIDGFCGPGKYEGGEEGSPVIATRMANSTAQKFPGFKATLFFVDEDLRALNYLASIDAIKRPHPNVTIEIKRGKFADQVSQLLAYLRQNPGSPTFSFIDPFGFGQSPFNKLKLLMHNEHSELLVNFMCGFMNRFKTHPDEEVTQKIKDMIGSDDLNTIINSPDPIDALCKSFERNLNSIGKFTLKFAMRDEGNIRDNAFFFCGRQPKGFEKIKEAMWKLDPEHGNEFSAHEEMKNNNVQGDLFRGEPQTAKLSSLLKAKFAGQKQVSVKRIFKWVIEDTASFIPKHARTELEKLLDRKEISFVDPDDPQRKRRKSAWPDRLLVDFK
jgi:three-Cys-motif partner protein